MRVDQQRWRLEAEEAPLRNTQQAPDERHHLLYPESDETDRPLLPRLQFEQSVCRFSIVVSPPALQGVM